MNLAREIIKAIQSANLSLDAMRILPNDETCWDILESVIVVKLAPIYKAARVMERCMAATTPEEALAILHEEPEIIEALISAFPEKNT